MQRIDNVQPAQVLRDIISAPTDQAKNKDEKSILCPMRRAVLEGPVALFTTSFHSIADAVQ